MGKSSLLQTTKSARLGTSMWPKPTANAWETCTEKSSKYTYRHKHSVCSVLFKTETSFLQKTEPAPCSHRTLQPLLLPPSSNLPERKCGRFVWIHVLKIYHVSYLEDLSHSYVGKQVSQGNYLDWMKMQKKKQKRLTRSRLTAKQ